MVRSRRTGVYNTSSTGGGGGPPPTPGSLAIGPDYGERAGNDGTTWFAAAAVALADMAATGQLGAAQAVLLDDMAAEAQLGAAAAVDLADMAAAAGLTAATQVTLDDMAATADTLAAATALTLADMAAEAQLGAAAAADLQAMDGSGGTSAAGALTATATFDNLLSDEDTELRENQGDTTRGANAAITAKQPTPILNNERIAYIAWDLTAITGPATVDTATILIVGETDDLISENGDVEVYTNAAKPFEEDTATWNNSEPPPGTLRETIVVNWNPTPNQKTLTLNATTRANMLGNWLFLRILGAGALGENIITVVSKEGAAADRPDLSFEVTV